MSEATQSMTWLMFQDYDARRNVVGKYNEVKEFIERERRNPSKHRIEEHDMLNWLKASRKKMNAGELKEERLAKFKELLTLVEENKRKNQYA